MKVIILCGGLGTRLSEETKIKPKPMVLIDKDPIIIHIIDIYKKYGLNDFILALGYKGNEIKKYFKNKKLNVKIQLVDTGKNTLTGGRILRLKKYINKDEEFMVTYGDGLSSQNIKNLMKFHRKHKKIATMTVVRTPVRFGEVKIKKNKIVNFQEKPRSIGGDKWINGGFFVFNYKVFKFIKGDNVMLEREPMNTLSKAKELMAYRHHGFWQCMDTLREKEELSKLAKQKIIPWKI